MGLFKKQSKDTKTNETLLVDGESQAVNEVSNELFWYKKGYGSWHFLKTQTNADKKDR